MTIQSSDELIFQENEFWLLTYPMDHFLDSLSDRPILPGPTSCRRGYRATWCICESQLFLKSLLFFDENLSVDQFFPSYKERSLIPASWVDGVHVAEAGNELDHCNIGGSILRFEVKFMFKDGKLISETVTDRNTDDLISSDELFVQLNTCSR